MAVPVPNSHDSKRVPWLPTDGPASDKHVFFIMFGFFICALVAVASWSYTRGLASPEGQEYRWHFFGGKRYNGALGAITLFSTIFSAVTIAGVPYEASALGFFATRWLTSGVWVGIGALMTVPRFYRLSGLRGYDCPNDFVSDRFNNRALTLLTSLIGTATVFLYIIIQFYAIADLLPAMSRGQSGATIFDKNGTTWFLAVVIILCEWFGGYDAVTYTDMLQSSVLIFAFVSVPIAYGHYYGLGAGAGDVFGYDCDNYFQLNCTQQAFIDFGSPCASASTAAAFQTGCVAYSADYQQLYPAGVEESKFFEPITKVQESGCAYNYNLSLPSCTPTVLAQLGWFAATPPSTWNNPATPFPTTGPYSINRAWADKQSNNPLPTVLGVDSSRYFSRMAPQMFSFNLLFFALSLFPHWTQKVMSIKSDGEVRWAYGILSFATLWSTFPMVLVGVAGGALLKGIYPDTGSEFYSVILDDLANRGSFAEYISAFGAVGAIAAMMSTVDSALISVTNYISTDFLRHWLMPSAPGKVILRVCKAISFVTIVVCVCIALYDKSLQRDPNVYSTLIAWQSSLLWQILPVSMIALYWDLNAWAALIGQVCGLVAIGGLFAHEHSCNNWNTAYAWKKDSYVYEEILSGGNHPEECDTSTYILDFHVWGAFVNIGVTVILSILFNFLGVNNTSENLKMDHVNKRAATDEELSLNKIHSIMGKHCTREPLRDPVAVACMICAAILTTFSLPWWGTAYNDCDYVSYTAWEACEIAGVDCRAMCDRADMSLPPPLPVPALITQAAGCLNSSSATTCSCPLQGGYFAFSSGSTMIPTHTEANVDFNATKASLATGGSIVYKGRGNGKICDGYTLENGIPQWAMAIIGCWIVSLFFIAFAWYRWGTTDDMSQTEPTTIEMNVNQDEEKIVKNIAEPSFSQMSNV